MDNSRKKFKSVTINYDTDYIISVCYQILYFICTVLFLIATGVTQIVIGSSYQPSCISYDITSYLSSNNTFNRNIMNSQPMTGNVPLGPDLYLILNGTFSIVIGILTIIMNILIYNRYVRNWFASITNIFRVLLFFVLLIINIIFNVTIHNPCVIFAPKILFHTVTIFISYNIVLLVVLFMATIKSYYMIHKINTPESDEPIHDN